MGGVLRQLREASRQDPTQPFDLVDSSPPNARVQEELAISEGTAIAHRHNIYRKIDVRSEQELIDFVAGSQQQRTEGRQGQCAEECALVLREKSARSLTAAMGIVARSALKMAAFKHDRRGSTRSTSSPRLTPDAAAFIQTPQIRAPPTLSWPGTSQRPCSPSP